MSQQVAIRTQSFSKVSEPAVQFFSETPSSIRRVFGWLALLTSGGLALLGLMAVLAFVPGMTPKEYALDVKLFGYFTGGFLMLIGAVIAGFAIPWAFGWGSTFTWRDNRLVATQGWKTRAVPAGNIIGLTAERRESSPIVIEIVGEKSLEISRSVPHVGELVDLIEAARPIAPVQVSPTAPARATTTQTIQANQSWEQMRAQAMANTDDEKASIATKAKGAEPPLWCIKLLTGGPTLVGMAFYLHSCLFPHLSTGERSLDSCWFGYAMLYETFGPTLAVYIVGGTGLLLTVGGMIGIGVTTKR